MEKTELKQLSESSLKAMLADQKDKLRDLRFSASQNQLKNIRMIRDVKKTIARVLTNLYIKYDNQKIQTKA